MLLEDTLSVEVTLLFYTSRQYPPNLAMSHRGIALTEELWAGCEMVKGLRALASVEGIEPTTYSLGENRSIN